MRRGSAILIVVHVLGGIAVSGAARPALPQSAAQEAQAVSQSEFIFETAPFASAHASTIAETREGLVTAWFAGTREGAADIDIWLSRHVQGAWTRPIDVATGQQPSGERYPCWNPVLFEAPDKTLMLFYKVGPRPSSWWGMVQTSRDNGRTWTSARRLPVCAERTPRAMVRLLPKRTTVFAAPRRMSRMWLPPSNAAK